MGSIQPNSRFAAFAKSHSGFQGGNPKSPVWVSGIEYGGALSGNESFSPVESFPGIDQPEWRKNFLRYGFNRKLVKLLASIEGEKVRDYREFCEDRRVFAGDGLGLKLNLYPIQCRRAWAWSKAHAEITGFPTKTIYRGWCQAHRFPLFREWVGEYRPKIIIGSGHSHDEDFALAFCRDQEEFFAEPERFKIGRHRIIQRSIWGGKTILFTLPFLGPGGLMSDKDIDAFGRAIGKRFRQM